MTVPFRLKGTDWFWAGGAIGSSALMMALDKEGKKLGRNTISTYNHDFWDAPTAYGFIQYPSIAAGATYLTGLFVRDKWTRVTGRLWLEALFYSGTIEMGLRYATGRVRPYYSDNPWKYTWFQTNNDTESFPSGHTLVAFATSTVLAERIDNIYARIILYGFAGLTAYSRVLNNQHWISDVFVGGLLGFGTGWFVVQREKEREKEIKSGKKGGSKFSIYPTLNGVGITLKL